MEEEGVRAFAHELSSAEYNVMPAQTSDGAGQSRTVSPQMKQPVDAARPGSLDLIMRIPVTVKVVLGSASMPVSALTKLERGALIPLDRKVGEAVDIMVNGRLIARGEIVVVDEATSQFGVTLTEVGELVTGNR
jgi:flagellar motor switch protein FliN/FliY